MTSLKDYVGIKYRLKFSENFDEYMKALGVGVIIRQMANTAVPTIELFESEGTFTLKSSTPIKNTNLTFQLDKEFNDKNPFCGRVRSLVRADGPNRIIHTQRGEKEMVIIREFTKDECNMTLKVDDVVCFRVFKKI